MKSKTVQSLSVYLVILITLSACQTSTPPPTSTTAPIPIPTHTPVPTVEPPVARGYHSMAYDYESKRIIVYGGQLKDLTPLFDTWAYDPSTKIWEKLTPATSPDGSHGDMVYDPDEGRIIFVTWNTDGGMVQNGVAHTWAYDYNTNAWEQRADAPEFRNGTRLAYDAESHKVISFGGLTHFNETWAYDFKTDTWTQMQPESSPGGRNYHCMAYDTKSDKIIMWGGDEISMTPTQWMYDYNTNTWTELKYSNGPEKILYYCGLVYDEEVDNFLLYGGNGGGINETWMYNLTTNTWEQKQPSINPGYVTHHAMIFDKDTGKSILFGGQGILQGVGTAYLTSVWAYDAVSNTWELFTP